MPTGNIQPQQRTPGSRPRRIGIVALLLAVVVAGGWGWARRDMLRAWYLVRQLAQATEVDRERQAERVAELGETAVPNLLDCLCRPEATVCTNAGSALDKLGMRWGAGDGRTAALLRQIGARWPGLSAPGRQTALETAANWVRAMQPDSEPAEGLVPAAGELLAAVAKEDGAAREAALPLCDCLMTLRGADAAREPACRLVRACLKSASAEIRLRAVRTSLRPGMDLSEQVAVLLADPAVEVRRAAVVAVGPPDQAVPDETLLPCLHDADPEVRRLAEAALTELRGLKPIQLKLGRLISHPHFLERIRILDELYDLQRHAERSDRALIDTGVWMCRLSHDPMPSVRAAAAWAMARQGREDCTRRLAEMARDDPSPTVCYLARFYLKQAAMMPGE